MFFSHQIFPQRSRRSLLPLSFVKSSTVCGLALASALVLPPNQKAWAQAGDTTPATPEATPAAPASAATDDTPPVSLEELQQRLGAVEQKLDALPTASLDLLTPVLPGISSNVPTAYNAGNGNIAFGVGYQDRLRYTDSHSDGAVAAVVGLGDARKVGLDVQVSDLDLSRPFHRVALGLKANRMVAKDTFAAIGVENLTVSTHSDSGRSYYGAVSTKLRLKPASHEPFSRLYLTLGAGNGRFMTERQVFDGDHKINLFGSAAVNILSNATLFTEWTGESVNVGTSFIPMRRLPLVVTLAFADVAGPGGDGSRFTAGVGYVWTR